MIIRSRILTCAATGLLALSGIAWVDAAAAPPGDAQNTSAPAQDVPLVATPPQPADRSLAGDKVCTSCHDESETKPILSMYKTRHGVKADERTPGCQSCHGASVAHVKNIGGSGDRRASPDIVFGLHSRTDAQAQSGACLQCHDNGKAASTKAGTFRAPPAIPCM